MLQTMEEVVSCRIRLSKKPIHGNIVTHIFSLCVSLYLSGEYDSALFALGKICTECRGREGEGEYGPLVIGAS